jgi:hypothetical protein
MPKSGGTKIASGGAGKGGVGGGGAKAPGLINGPSTTRNKSGPGRGNAAPKAK